MKANKKYGYFKAGKHSTELRKACNLNSLIITVSQYFFSETGIHQTCAIWLGLARTSILKH